MRNKTEGNRMLKTRAEIKANARQAMKGRRGTCIGALVLMSIIVGMGSLFGYIPILGTLIVWATVVFIDWPLMVGVENLFIRVYKREQVAVDNIFAGFSGNYMRKVGGMAWMQLWMFIWALPAVIMLVVIIVTMFYAHFTGPGFLPSLSTVMFAIILVSPPFILLTVKSLSYSLTPFILADCPDVLATEALNISKRMTKGYKGHLAMFFLSWIVWFIPGVAVIIGGAVLSDGLGILTLMWLIVLVYIILVIVHINPYLYTSHAGYYIELKNKAIEDGIIEARELGIEEIVENTIENTQVEPMEIEDIIQDIDKVVEEIDQELS